jgi:hypothetical protein
LVVVRLFDPIETEEIRQEVAGLATRAAAANHSTIYLSFFEEDGERRVGLEQAVVKRLDPALRPWVAAAKFRTTISPLRRRLRTRSRSTTTRRSPAVSLGAR